jgi:lipid II:glycine glycyltransferase (peptidoglycan interpeptide bridge formation enzyme)
VLFEGRLDGRMVGGCLCFACNDRAALAFYICDDPEARQYRVVEGVLYSCIMWLKERGFAYLDLGTISIDGEVNWGLARFKSKFMARTQVREKYVLEIEEGS